MLEELSAEQWAEWVAFYALEPWGFDVLDGFNAMLAATAARAWGADVKPDDFLIARHLSARIEEAEAAKPDLHETVKMLFGHKAYAGKERKN